MLPGGASSGAVFDLSRLPPPSIIDPLDFEQILEAMKADLAVRWPEFDALLESDPAMKLLEVEAYRELLLRARVNDVFLSRLLAFATGSNLDHVGAFWEVARLDGEGDEPFRERIALTNKGRSTGGSKYWYEAAARRADVRVKSATAWRETLLPTIHIAILSTDNGGIPSSDILAAVNAEVQSDAVRLISDTVIVEAAVSQVTDIEADLWLLPSATGNLVEQIKTSVREAWEAEAGIGFDLELSWLQSRMHLSGVKRVQVNAPPASVVAPEGVAIALGEITLNVRGTEY